MDLAQEAKARLDAGICPYCGKTDCWVYVPPALFSPLICLTTGKVVEP